MARQKPAGRPQIALFADSWTGPTFAKLAGALGTLAPDFRPEFVDYGPTPMVPEASAADPPWKGRASAVFIDTATAGDPSAFAAWIERGGVPALSLNAELLDTVVPTVCIDYHELGRLAAEHLMRACRCRSFIHLGIVSHTRASARREDGFRTALAAEGRELVALRVPLAIPTDAATPPPLRDRQFDAVLQQLPRPVGMLASTDPLAVSGLDACRRLGLRVPDDVSVIGVGNTMLAHTHRPSLTSIHVQSGTLGVMGMTLIRGLLRGEPPPATPVLVGGSVLHPRESTVGRFEDTAELTVDVAMERINAEACRGLTVDRLAHVLKVSDRWLRKLFEDELGVSPNQEIQRVRFERAALLLKNTRMPIARVASAVGFSHATGLSLFFRRMIGMTPRDYRVVKHRHGSKPQPRPRR